MNTTRSAACAAVLVALLASCAGIDRAEESVAAPVVVSESVAVEKIAPPPVAQTAEPVGNLVTAPADAAYLQAARSVVAGTNLNALADADLIGLAKTFCDAITNGATKADFAKSAELMNVPLRTYRSVVALAEITYCPQHVGFRI